MASKRRSAEYYRSPEGRKKKLALNAARQAQPDDEGTAAAVSGSPAAPLSALVADSAAGCASPTPDLPAVPQFKESIIQYTRLVMSQTDRRAVSREEALATLQRVVRQRGLDST